MTQQLSACPQSSLFKAPLLLCAVIILLNTQSLACDFHRNIQVQSLKANTDPSLILSSQRSHDDTNDSGATLTVGIIAGITIGGVVLVLVIVLLVLFLSRRCTKTTTKEEDNGYQGFADWRKDRNLTSVDIERDDLESGNLDIDVSASGTSRDDGLTHV